MESFFLSAQNSLNSVLASDLPTPVTRQDLESPPEPGMGEIAFPCFKLAKALRKAPPAIAAETAKKIQESGTLPSHLTVQAKGPYVNFFVRPETLFRAVLSEILPSADATPGTNASHFDTRFGSLPANSRGKWVLEYSSPNIAKPFQIYHLRPTALGACLARVGRYRGFHLITLNHLGDWGTQYGKLTVAFRLFSKDLPAEPTITDLVGIYVKFHALLETQPELEDEAREAFAKLEKKDPEMMAVWKKCVDISMKEFNSLYARLGITFDHIWGESFYEDKIPAMIQRLEQARIIEDSEGARIVHVTDRAGKEIPPCLIVKKDGASIYATRDLTAALYRWDQFQFDRMTYIVGQEQKLHFQQVFGVLRRLGCEWEPRCEHVPFGLYRFKDSKMSTRKGNFVTLNDMIELAESRVRELMTERMKGENATQFSPAEFESIIQKVALGAVVFHDLSVDPAKEVEFDVERVVDFQGETGPYLQYAHTRCLSILKKAAEKTSAPSANPSAQNSTTGAAPSLEHLNCLEKAEELQLIKTLAQFPSQLERTLEFAKASHLANFLIDVTHAFNTFYRECHVIGDDTDLTSARVLLVDATRRVLAQGMDLLGVPRPERM